MAAAAALRLLGTLADRTQQQQLEQIIQSRCSRLLNHHITIITAMLIPFIH